MQDTLSSDLASLRLSRDEPPPSRGIGRTLLVVALVLGGCAAAVGAAYPHIEASLFKTEVNVTEISLISPAQGTVDLTTTGYVIAERSSKVGARAAGRLARVLVSEGDVVKAGQPLATLEDSVERSAIATARARLSAAGARELTARANLEEAQLRATREQTLVQRGAGTLAVLQDAEARSKSQRETLRATGAEAQAASAEISALQVNLQNMIVTAPMAGTVVTRPARAGELVGPGTAPILELADFTSLVVETDVPEGRLARVRPGGPCEIVLDAYPSRRLRGQTLALIPKVNRAKATVPVKVKFLDPTDGVLPEMAARVSFLQHALDEKSLKEPPRLVVPQAAVVDRDGTKIVFVVDSGVVRQTPVLLGPEFAGGFELKQGPPAGTRVVVSPPSKMADGHKIKEKNE